MQTPVEVLCGAPRFLQTSSSQPHCQQLQPVRAGLPAPELEQVGERRDARFVRGEEQTAAQLHTGAKPKIQSEEQVGGRREETRRGNPGEKGNVSAGHLQTFVK